MAQQSLQKYFPSTIRPSILNTWSLVPERRRRRRTNSQIQKPFPPKATRDETLLQGKTSLSIIGLHTLQINENVWQFGVRAPILIIMLMDVRSVMGDQGPHFWENYFSILGQHILNRKYRLEEVQRFSLNRQTLGAALLTFQGAHCHPLPC